MKNAHQWTPTKFTFDPSGRLRANARWVNTGSLMIADLTARWWQGAIDEHLRGDVLDLGCGSVPLYETYAPYASSVTCVDWQDNGHLDVVMNLNDPIDLPSGTFDTVILSDVLEHIREPQRLVAEVFRLLRPGGVVLINTPFYYWLHEEPYDYCRYTEFWLRTQLEETGFAEVGVDPLGGYVEVVTDLLGKGLSHASGIPPGLSRGVQRLSLKLGERPLAARMRELTARKFPLSYGTTAVKPAA